MAAARETTTKEQVGEAGLAAGFGTLHLRRCCRLLLSRVLFLRCFDFPYLIPKKRLNALDQLQA